MELLGERVKHRRGLGNRRGGAGGHHRHGAGGGLGGAAADRAVDHHDIAFGQTGGDIAGFGGRNGRALHHHRPRFQPGRRAVLAKQHAVDLVGVDHENHQHIDPGGHA